LANIHQIFRIDKCVVEMIDLIFVFRSLKGCCYGNQLLGRIGENGLRHLHSSRWHSKTDWRIAASTATTLYIMYHLQFNYPGIYETILCTAVDDQYYGLFHCHSL